MLVLRGVTLSESKIENVLKNLSPTDRERLLDGYWHLVNLDVNEEDKIAELICSIPNAGLIPDGLMMYQLTTGPLFNIPKDCIHTINWYIKNIIVKQDRKQVQSLCDYMSSHKHCPDKYKTKHMLLQILIQQAMDEEFAFADLEKVDDEQMWKGILKGLKDMPDAPEWIKKGK